VTVARDPHRRGIVVAAVLALKVAALFLESRLTFYPVREHAATPRHSACRSRTFRSRPTTASVARLAHSRRGKRSLTLLFFHGNAENIGGCLDLAMLTRPAGTTSCSSITAVR